MRQAKKTSKAPIKYFPTKENRSALVDLARGYGCTFEQALNAAITKLRLEGLLATALAEQRSRQAEAIRGNNGEG